MSDVSKLKPNGASGTEYDIKDAVARQMASVGSLSDTTPYLYRKSPAIGTRVMENALVGGSVVANQLVQNGNFVDTSNWSTTNSTLSVSSGVATITASASGNVQLYQEITQKVQGRKVLISFYCECSESGKTLNVYWGDVISSTTAPTTKQRIVILGTIGSGNNNFNLRVASMSANATVKYSEVNVIDLTQWFGSSTIPDTAYTKETAQAGSGIAWLKDNGHDFSKYIPYNTGTLESVEVTGKEVVGKNLFDKNGEQETTYGVATISGEKISVTGTYYCKFPINLPVGTYSFSFDIDSYTVTRGIRVEFEDGTMTTTFRTGFTLSEQQRIVGLYLYAGNGTSGTTVYSNVQIEFGSRATAYVPYEKHTYAYPETTLRGLFKLVNDSIVANGDRLESDGTHEVVYDEVDLGSLSWSLESTTDTTKIFAAPISGVKVSSNSVAANMITKKYLPVSSNTAAIGNTDFCFGISTGGYIRVCDSDYSDATTFKNSVTGQKLVYEKATTSTEQLAPFDNPQISIVNGTEQFITNTDVPVGHESEYKRLPVMFEDDYIQTIAERAERSVFTHDTLVDTYSDSGGILDYTDDYAQITFNLDKSYSRTSLLPPQTISADYTDCTMIAQGIDVSLFNVNNDDISGKAFAVLEECTDLGNKIRVVIGLYNLRLDSTTGSVNTVDIAVHFAIFGAINRVLVESE